MKLNKNYKTALILVLKSKQFLALIKAAKLFKFAKPFIAMISVAISLFAYSLTYSISLAIAFIISMFVHELGHVYAINRLGLKAGRMIFIPFFGAMVGAPPGMDRRQEAYVGIGGPWAGTLLALLFIGCYLASHNTWFLHTAYLGLLINLFNMIPITPMDGGRITQAIGGYFNVIGLGLLVLLTIALGSPLLLLLWIIAFLDLQWLNKTTKLIAALLTEIVLIVMLFTKTGINTKIEFRGVVVDIIIGAILITAFYVSNFLLDKEDQEIINERHQRPALDPKAKIKWFMVWLLTTLFLLGAIGWLVASTNLSLHVK